MLSKEKSGENSFFDSNVMKFLDLPKEFHENDLRKALIRNMKNIKYRLEGGFRIAFVCI